MAYVDEQWLFIDFEDNRTEKPGNRPSKNSFEINYLL